MALKGNFRAGIGFLKLHAPVEQSIERDWLARDRAADELSW